VQGTGHRAQGTGNRAQGIGHRAQGTGHRAQGTGHSAQGTGHRAQGTGHRARLGFGDQGLGRRVQDHSFRFRVEGLGLKVSPASLKAYLFILVFGLGFRAQGSGCRVSGFFTMKGGFKYYLT
jgi:hypothetical protein